MPELPSDKFLDTFSPVSKVSRCEFIEAHQALDFFELWDALEKELGKECIPFWGAVWPGAKSLARYIKNKENLVRNKKILDFGCGSGIVSIASALFGAGKVVANDIDPVALHIAGKNFTVNQVNIIKEPSDLLSNCKDDTFFDLIFVVDMFYERSTSGSLLGFLYSQIERGAEVIIADGERPFAPQSRAAELFREEIVVNRELEGADKRTVRIMRLNPNI